jgi:hypothetical protein
MHALSAHRNVAVNSLGSSQGLQSQCLSKQLAALLTAGESDSHACQTPLWKLPPDMAAGPSFGPFFGMQEVTAADGNSILWWGIDVVDPAHSAPSQLESQGRGEPRLW